MQNLKNSIYSLADLNIGPCVELTFEGKLGGFFAVNIKGL